MFSVRRYRLLLIGLFCALTGAASDAWASAKPVACPPEFVLQNGFAYGHRPYEVAADSFLEEVIQPAAARAAKRDDVRECRLRPDAANALRGLLIAAAEENIILYMRSCHRTRQQQINAYCNKRVPVEERVLESAPPGFSEHHTGYALDFGDLAYSRDCQLNACFEGTPGNRWLQENAASFGFERSFPENNSQCFNTADGRRQCATSEPWHWRYVGNPVQGRVPVDLFDAANRSSPASPSPRS